MTTLDLVEFIRRHKYAVVSSVAASISAGAPQSAVVGIAVGAGLEIVFDTLKGTRKYRNLIANPAVALAVWTGEATVQYEGIATETVEDRYREMYFATWPDGRDRLSWPGITHFVIRPKWIRYTDFDARPPLIEEFTF